jgi:hypothetical protein
MKTFSWIAAIALTAGMLGVVGSAPANASSEHSSVRGTINAGGDFIKRKPPAGAGCTYVQRARKQCR